jgi:hypothetical protein
MKNKLLLHIGVALWVALAVASAQEPSKTGTPFV